MWMMRCLLCARCHDVRDLVYMQKHVMFMHDYTVDDLRSSTKREIAGGYIWTMPDGKDWLMAVRI